MTSPKSARPGAVASDLDRSLVTGVAWSGAGMWTTQALTWVSTLIVARLLTPADFGVVGMAGLYLGLVGMLTEFGIGSAVVAIRELTDRQVAQLNMLAVVLGASACALSLGLAHPLAAFFREPRLTAVVMVGSAVPLVSGFGVVPGALLRRDLRFRRVAAYEAVGTFIAAASTLGLAGAGWGYWALVLGPLFGAASRAAMFVGARHRPLAWPHRADVGRAFSFSREVLTARLSWYAFANADFLVAGKLLGASQLGAYKLAWTFASLPLEKLVSLVGRVTPAVLSAVQDEPAQLKRYVLRITEVTSLVLFPAGVGLALVADDFVAIVLGDQWLAATGPLRILSAYAVVRGLSPLWWQVLMVTGDTRFSMRVSALGAVFLPLGFLAGSHWGLIGIALAWPLVHPPVVMVPIFRRLMERIRLHPIEYVRCLVPAATCTLVMAAVVLFTRFLMHDHGPMARLVSEVAVGCVSYTLVVGLIRRQRLTGLARALSASFRPRT